MSLNYDQSPTYGAEDLAGHDQEAWPSDYALASVPASQAIRLNSGYSTNLIDSSLIRICDIVFATALLITAFPFLIILACALQLDSPGRLFFVQQRIGRGGKSFPCIKFRTMCEDANERLAAHLASCAEARAEWARDFKLKDDPRITPLGKLARRYSLDELPQLLNIICGHMSVVGPRPIVEAEIPRYGEYFAHFCAVRPGLTGLWQISGRNDISYSERVALDCRYVAERSFVGYIKIIAQTVPAVLLARGSY